MKYQEVLFEKRRNPKQNNKLGIVDFLRQYKDDPTIYIHTTDLLKVGIYPKSSDGLDSPVGIYAYRLVDIWADDIERWNTGEYNRGLEFLPYHGGNHVFVLRSNIDPNFPKDYTEENLQQDIEKIKKLFRYSDEMISQIKRTARTNQNFRDCPAGYLWGMTKAMVGGGVSEFDQYTNVDCKKWNYVLRKLGYIGFNDPGYGLIHGAESSQAVFLTTSAFKIIDHSLISQKQKIVSVGDKKYKGGRIPRDLYMDGIPNVLFHNNKPEDFAKVHTWTVNGMAYYDVNTFSRFVPWNGKGIINRIYMDTESRSGADFLKKPIPKNIKIKNLYISGRMPELLLMKIPEDYPVDTISTSKYIPLNQNYIDKLPEKIRAKLRQE